MTARDFVAGSSLAWYMAELVRWDKAGEEFEVLETWDLTRDEVMNKGDCAAELYKRLEFTPAGEVSGDYSLFYVAGGPAGQVTLTVASAAWTSEKDGAS